MNPHERFIHDLPRTEQLIGEALSIDGLTADFRIYQRLKGHRHSIDDAATSWYALQKSPRVSRALDLGSGIGSVGLAVLWGLGAEASLVCIEAQEISYKLLEANIAGNGVGDRVRAMHGDLRDVDLGEKFPLVTGSPPYFPINSGVLPPDSQKAHARFELRGDVSDYARAAIRHLEPNGWFVFCFPFQQKSRCIELVHGTGMRIVSVKDVVPHPNKPPLFSLYAARLHWDGEMEVEPPLIVSTERGHYSTEMLELQRSRGFGDLGTNQLG